MTTPLTPPPRKNPEKRTVSPTLPPAMRSRAAMGMTAAASEGRFALQACAECGAPQYPARDACVGCLSPDLRWQDVSPNGKLLAETTVRTSTNLYFRERAPWRTGTVRLDVGPVIICHIHGDVAPHARVRLLNRLDRSGQGVLIAMPEHPTPDMQDDPEMRVLTSDPKLRRVLIADGRNPNAPAIAAALGRAGATTIFVGEAERWRPNPVQAALLDLPGVSILPLDVTDTASVQELAGEIGGKVDILINNARFIRPGGVLSRGDTAFAAQEMEVNALGLMRLAQAFGPGMCARTADGVNSAVAFVNVLSAHALVSLPDYGSFAASQAAALSLSQCLRSEFRASGLRVMNLFVGPTDDDWHQPLPPPKVTPKAIAADLVRGLQDGLEDVFCGDVAKELVERFRAGPKVLEREMTMGGGS
ncbi:SDR family NAD(P)-dependent oxidoreductase [Paracoccus aurantiacus]|uniref:SDR family NAD(P)-dependent oxidoreductase n=1 Tax=Paracoccus aurantiacus TaxID=2599412 RepID=A0A5C6RZL3_9RHOB|nr:SDR family NAD(P)-dependent oxidoreductase [Paracoccus aurantiacus]TXB67731.1 SDR family NAD(P)-dependent oxidoreductase [Paracoccus aurantiacus]